MAEEGTAHATHMKGARFTIPTPALLAKSGAIGATPSAARVETLRSQA
jgi:hypothetical protein